AGKIRHSHVEMVAEFVTVPTRLKQVMALKPGDVMPIDLPDLITARVDDVPVLECEYGSHERQRALRVRRVINHAHVDEAVSDTTFTRDATAPAEDPDHE